MARACKPRDPSHAIHVKGDKGGHIDLVKGGPRLAYLWVGDARGSYVATFSGENALRKLAKAILREVGGEGGE